MTKHNAKPGPPDTQPPLSTATRTTKCATKRAAPQSAQHRTCKLTFRVTPDEQAYLAAQAAAANLTIGAYCRTLALSGTVAHYPRLSEAATAALLQLRGELGKIGSNLNQIARKFNSDIPVERTTLLRTLQDVRTLSATIEQTLARTDRV